MADKHAEEEEKGKEDEEDERDEEEEKGEKKKEEPVPLKWVLKYYIFVNQAFCEVSPQYQYLYDSISKYSRRRRSDRQKAMCGGFGRRVFSQYAIFSQRDLELELNIE